MTGYLTIPEAAKALRVSQSLLRELHRREGLPIIRLSARRYIVSEQALRNWLEQRTISTWPGEHGEPAASTQSATANGGRRSAAGSTRSASGSGANGNVAQKRPPGERSTKHAVASLAAFRRRKAE